MREEEGTEEYPEEIPDGKPWVQVSHTDSVPIGDLNPKPLIAVVTSDSFNPYTTGPLPKILFVYISFIAEFSHGLQVSGAVWVDSDPS